MSFCEVWTRARAVATWLKGNGVKKGDRVALSCRNYWEWVVVFVAVVSFGFVALPLNALWSSKASSSVESVALFITVKGAGVRVA
jgi:long-chain acyl-CoA synthetase